MSKIKHEETKFNNVMEKIKECKVHGEIIDLINKTLPNWIITFLDGYSDDYPLFREIWEKVCQLREKQYKKETGNSDYVCKPLSVVIVDTLDKLNSEDKKISQQFSELLTIFGHSVRYSNEFTLCKYCNKAVPVKNYWKNLKDAGNKVPEIWSLRCSNC